MSHGVRPRRVYVAGPISAPAALTVLANIGAGIEAGRELFLAGYAPFCPHLDYHYALPGVTGLDVSHFYAYSKAWLEVADAVLLLPGWESSAGAQAEARRASECGIPMFLPGEPLPPPEVPIGEKGGEA